MDEIIIYGFAVSPFVRSVMMALEIKGAPYRLEGFEGGMGGEAHHLLHPFGRVPVIDHGAYRLYETQAILRYIDARFPGEALQPATPEAIGRMSQVMGVNDCYLFPQAVRPIGFQRVIGPAMRGITPDEELVAAALPCAKSCFAELDRLLGDSLYLAGDRLTLADLLLAPQIALLAATPEVRAFLKGTRLKAWLERMFELPAMTATLPPEMLKVPSNFRELAA